MKNQQKAVSAAPVEPVRGDTRADADLVRAATRGDKQAFVEIVARHQAMVCGVALGIVGSIAASEDVAQEAFLTAWRKIHDLREPEKLRGGLREISRNVALSHLRRQRGHDVLEDVPDLPDVSPTPDEQAASKEEEALVRQALTQLPEMYREPLILYYREHQSTKAVAEALDLSEEAVRQRLARGREMLRDQVTDSIIGVLSRTRPTPIFTMTVAFAIGALASPAAVAGGVFSAATAAGAATRVSFFRGAAASKSFLFMAAIATVVCIPLGYQLRARGERTKVVAPDVSRSVAVSRPKVLTALEDSAIFAEWKRLHEVHGTNVQAMPGIYKEIAGFNDPLRQLGFRAALMAEWVQLNPSNVVTSFRDRIIDANQRRQFVDEWLTLDAATAVTVFMKGGRTWEATVRNSLAELARRAPDRVASVVAKLPKSENGRDRQVQEAFEIVAERGLESARVAAETMTGPNRDQALAGVAQTWGRRDFDGALAWARKLSDGTDRDEVIRSALVGSASVNPLSALDQVSLVPPGGRKGYFASTTGARVLQQAAAVDFDGTVGWLTVHPGRLSHEDLLGLASAVGEKLNANAAGFLTQQAAAGSLSTILPAITNALVKESSGRQRAVWDWVKGQAEDSSTSLLRRQLLGTLGEQDTVTAFQLAEAAPQTTEGDAQLRLLADGLLGHGAVVHRLDQLLEAAPPRLHQPLLEKAFGHLHSEALGDPHQWATRLSQLPDAARGRAAEALARTWAEQTPEGAIRWAASMPAGETRAKAVAGIASSWAAKDAPAASVWIAAMPAGAERDCGAQSLVAAIAEEFPREAWEWALSIADTERRNLAATHAAKMMAARDSAVARAWIEDGPFTPEAKAALQSALETASEAAP